MFNHLRKKIVSLMLLVLLATQSASAIEAHSPNRDNNLTDIQLHAVMGIITNFILSSDLTIQPITWINKNSKVYGAKSDSNDLIGGGNGYSKVISSWTVLVSTYRELKEAINNANANDIIYIEPGKYILFPEDEYLVLNKNNVTIASNRGKNNSKGAILFKLKQKNKSHFFEIRAKNIRITGLTINGAYKSALFTNNNTNGIEVYDSNYLIDNNEIYGFSFAAINVKNGDNGKIEYNYIHHNQRLGLGYGVVTYGPMMNIQYNIFDYNRHHIAGDGSIGSGYIAKHNWVKHSTFQAFDMHGFNGDGSFAGTKIIIENNYFEFKPDAAASIFIRGNPLDSALVTRNLFKETKNKEKSIWVPYSDGNNIIRTDNLYNK